MSKATTCLTQASTYLDVSTTAVKVLLVLDSVGNDEVLALCKKVGKCLLSEVGPIEKTMQCSYKLMEKNVSNLPQAHACIKYKVYGKQ